MKHFISIMILFLGFQAAAAFGQQAAFDRATTLLEEQQYSDAINQYKNIYQEGYESGALWLNLGVAYAQLDSLGKAKFYMLRASEFSETEELARQSLDVIENRLSRRSAVLPMLPWDRFFEFLDHYPGRTGLMVLGLLFLNLTAAFMLAAWFRPGLKKFFKRLSSVSAVLTIMLLFFSIFLSLQDNWYDVGVIVKNEATVYDQPATDSAIVSTAYEGYTMRVHTTERAPEADGDWYYVRLANGLYGWVDRQAVLTY
ncbi:SH3 domain-containing protein [Rhodohalobacter sp. 8-1]|uniref:SH3 domain-containing protein n=1 Tax=Rhodohalobacter sp. 8-1 TaxID=3131972 RepID=UPI0030EB75E2